LLFVAASLRPETVLGRGASARAQAVVGSAFTALVNSFFVSIIALIPGTSLGYTAAVMGVLSLYSTWRLHHELAGYDAAVLQLVMAVAAYLGQLGVGITLALNPHDTSLVYDVAYLLIGSFAVALRRAWSVMQGRHLPANQNPSQEPTQEPSPEPSPEPS
jgi:hypothetical protein